MTTPLTPYIIYGLVDPDSKLIRYIGKSSSRLERPQQHQLRKNLATDPNLGKVSWITGLLAEERTYEIVILEECENVDQLHDAEAFHINFFSSAGCPLTNIKGTMAAKAGKIRGKVSVPPYREAKRAWEQEYFQTMVLETGGNMPAMVFASGMHRSTLYDKLKELGIWT
jgi:hypothetical protein